MSPEQRIRRLEQHAASVEHANRFSEFFYDTFGELMMMLPPGVVPEMPVDTFVKPDLSSAVSPKHNAQAPDPRSRERPGEGIEHRHDGPVTFATPYRF